MEGSIFCEKHPDGGLSQEEAKRARRTHGRKSPKIVKPRRLIDKRRSAARRTANLVQKRLGADIRRWRKQRTTLRGKQERQQERDRKRIEAAAEYCLSVAQEGLISASASKVTDSLDDEVSQALRRTWKPKRCKWLARVAKSIDNLKKYVHGLLADLIVKVIWRRPEQVFVRQLLTHIPLPGDEQLTAAINAVRVVGVSMCLLQGTELRDCECFKTLALAETKKRVKEILTSAGDKWLKVCAAPDAAAIVDGLF